MPAPTIRLTVNPSNLDPAAVLHLFAHTGMSRPNWTPERMGRALAQSPLVVGAWHEAHLVGFARALTDFTWIAYLSQIAVHPAHQRHGLGRNLVDAVTAALGDEVALVVHSIATAAPFYRAVGFEPYDNVFRLPRQR